MRVLAILIVAATLLSFDDPKLKRTRVSDDISILVPVGWRPMDELDFAERYPSVRTPIAAFTDENRLIDLSVNVSATQWPDADVTLASQFFKASILNTFDRVAMISEGIRDIRGKRFIYFEFESTIRGNPKELGQEASIMRYSYIEYLVQSGRTLVFSFHCPRRMKDAWQHTALQIMENIRVK